MSKGVVPPGGWFYQQGPNLLRAGDFESLVTLVENHRRSNKLAPGDVRAEIEDQICQRSSEGCTGPVTSAMAQLAKFTAAMYRWSSSGSVAVSQEEANRRAEICATCHANQATKGGCSTCGKAKNMFLEGVKKIKVGPRAVSQEDKLHNCQICGCLNSFQVNVPLEAFGLTDQDKLAYPTFCWKKG